MTAKTRILQWAVWTPEVGTPDVSAIAPLLRRRMSPLTRMAVAVGLDCCRKAGVVPTLPRVVFASRHGEMGVTVDLLRQMAAEETISPTGFSNSVHHAAVGYWSLAAANRQAMRAVAGGEASFCYGFLETIGMLDEADYSPVLLIAADDYVPPPFDGVAGPLNRPYAAAFLLERAAPDDEGVLTFEMRGRAEKQSTDGHARSVPALDFLQWFLKGEKSLDFVLGRRAWRWEK